MAGLAINLFALGATTFLMRTIFGVQGGYYDPTMPGLPEIHIPIVARPSRSLGPLAVGTHGRSCTSAIGAAVVVLQVLLFHHKAGLRTAGGGGGPGRSRKRRGARAAHRATCAVLGCGLLCGLAGAQLSLGLVTQFVEGMTAGRGFIALVAVMFGRAHPIGVLAPRACSSGARTRSRSGSRAPASRHSSC